MSEGLHVALQNGRLCYFTCKYMRDCILFQTFETFPGKLEKLFQK